MGIANLASRIHEYESGKLNRREFIELFQNLVGSGLAWTLQPRYGRTARRLIEGGRLCPRREGVNTLLFEFDMTGLNPELFNFMLDHLNKVFEQKNVSGVNERPFLNFGAGCLRVEKLDVVTVDPRGATSLFLECEVDVAGCADCIYAPYQNGQNKHARLPFDRIDISIIEILGEPKIHLSRNANPLNRNQK